MNVTNAGGYSYNARYRLQKPADDAPYILTAFNIPNGCTLVLHGLAEGDVRIREEISQAPTTLKLSLALPEIYAECIPHPFPIHLSEGARPIRLAAAPR